MDNKETVVSGFLFNQQVKFKLVDLLQGQKEKKKRKNTFTHLLLLEEDRRKKKKRIEKEQKKTQGNKIIIYFTDEPLIQSNHPYPLYTFKMKKRNNRKFDS